MTVMEARVVDSTHLELLEAIDAPSGHRLIISAVDPKEDTGERSDWLQLSAQGLERAYGEDEPEYSPEMIKWVNPEFEA